MRVGLLTTWRTQCGIAEYSAHLARALQRAGAEVTIFGSRNDATNGRDLAPEPDEPFVVPTFDVQPWRADRRHGFAVEEVLLHEVDVLHVQYEVLLYHRLALQELLERFAGVKAITFHDSCIPPDLPGPWDLAFRHRADTGPYGEVIPFGIESVPPVVKTFGLGRSQAELIGAICDRRGWHFEASFGDREWKTQAQLHEWLRGADVIVLWYPDVEAAGSSQAARTAIATRRPVIVNDVTWFRDLPWGWIATAMGLIHAPDKPQELENALDFVLRRTAQPYIEANSWDHVARLHLDAYTEAQHAQDRQA